MQMIYVPFCHPVPKLFFGLRNGESKRSSRVESMRFNDRDRANKSSRKRIIAYTVKLCRRSTQDFTGKTGGERRKGKKLNPRDIRWDTFSQGKGNVRGIKFPVVRQLLQESTRASVLSVNPWLRNDRSRRRSIAIIRVLLFDASN